MENDNKNFSFDSIFYTYLFSTFTQGLKILFGYKPNTKAYLINATFNPEKNKYYLEVEFNSKKEEPLKFEEVNKKDLN
jgi:hypothetical protein